MSVLEPEQIERVAVIGMAGRFPGARNVDELWKNLCAGIESVRTLTDEELLAAGIPAAVIGDEHYVKAGAPLEGADRFDARFFGMPPREAEITDPQHRVFLECSYEALENAGYDPARYRGLIGVYGGSSMSTYLTENLHRNPVVLHNADPLQVQVGNDKDFVPTRVSYKLNLRGPSVNVQTACSTSLVAVHLACQGLLEGACDIALAGGVSIRFPHPSGYRYQEEGILSPDGHCRTFDANARGTVGGNGAGIVVLKRLSEAIADGDTVLAVIRGSAINNDGSLKVGYTAPSVEGQADVIAAAQAIADVMPDSIGYIEAHGTGTNLGDPIEMAALGQVFQASTGRKHFCAVGSVKTNLGHLDAAAGVTGLIKTVLQLRHCKLVPSLHFERPNPKIDFDRSPFYVNVELRDWSSTGPRRAGVSSFGIGGTNAHVVLEEAPAESPAMAATSYRTQLLVLSAKTRSALAQTETNLADHLRESPDASLPDIAYTTQMGRTPLLHRAVISCRTNQEATERLGSRDAQHVWRGKSEEAPAIVFMFPGQGSQYHGMGRELYETDRSFRTSLDECFDLLRPHTGVDLRSVLFAESTGAPDQLQETRVTQPALFAIEYALARLWRSWGLEPAAMVGHSIGEYVAACLSGVLTLAEALELVALRGRLMQELPRGSMATVPLSGDEVRALLPETLSLAAVNAPASSVIAGESDAIARFMDELNSRGVASRLLRTSHAFHSAMMEPMLPAFKAAATRAKLKAPSIPYLSNVTGTWITEEQATDSAYWTAHLRSTVNFAKGVSELLAGPYAIFLEVGPGDTLATLVRKQISKDHPRTVLTSLSRADQQRDGHTIEALGRAWVAGAPANWDAFRAGETRRRVPLPAYPFERESYLVKPLASPAFQPSATERLPLERWFSTTSWERSWLDGSRSEPSEWLIAAESVAVGDRLRAGLERCGNKVVMVTSAAKFARAAGGDYQARFDLASDFERVIEEVATVTRRPSHFVYVANGSSASSDPLQAGFLGALALVQAVRRGAREAATLTVIGNGMCEVTGDELLSPARAAMLGLCRSAMLEQPGLRTKAIDVEPSSSHAGCVIDELLSGSAEPVVAYRNGYRWKRIFRPVSSGSSADAVLRSGGVYLIVGGMGSIGRALARELAASVRAKLILTRHSSESPSLVAELERLGAEVLVVDGDATDRESMRAVVEAAENRFGQLHGVIHAAGVHVVRGVGEISPAECACQFEPKSSGLPALEHALEDRPLDFCLVISSLSAILGVRGFGAYAAAHAVADAFVQKHNRTGAVRWTCVDLDNWLPEMPADRDAPAVGLSSVIRGQEGIDVFKRVLGMRTRVGQVVVSTADLQARLDQDAARSAPESPQSHTDEYARPNLDTTYVPPRSDTEAALAAIWSRLLGIGSVGVFDNFFELGGDSVMSIQLVARANEQGLQLTPRQVFECKTIAELAAVAGTAKGPIAEQGEVHGPVPLTPIARWFLEQAPAERDHFNLAFLFRVPADLDLVCLNRALTLLMNHHDALRLRLTFGNGIWHQENAAGGEAISAERVDLKDLPRDGRPAVIRATSDRLHTSLSLAAGPLMRAAWFDYGPDEDGRLLLVIHHLAVDLVSWRVLLEDLERSYGQLRVGQLPRLPAKTTSFRDWANFLDGHARAGAFDQELPYWTRPARASVVTLPRDFEGLPPLEESAGSAVASLDPGETRALLQDVPPVYNTQINDALLTALAMAFAKWTGVRSLLLDLEGIGRDPLNDSLDLSRTVGWFTTIYPVLLELPRSDNPGEALKSIKEQIRQIPGRGLGYGALRYLSAAADTKERLGGMPRAEVSFLYQGQSGIVAEGSALLLGAAPEPLGAAHSPRTRLTHLISINGYMVDASLRFEWTFSNSHYRPATIRLLAEDYVQRLRSLIGHCRSVEVGSYTPSDFAAARIGEKDFDSLLGRLQRSSPGTKR